MSIHKVLDLLGSIHDPLLQHQRDSLGNLSAKGQLVEFTRACRVLAENIKKLNQCAEMISAVSSMRPDGEGLARAILSDLELELDSFLEESVPFREHSWFDVVEIFSQKSNLLTSSLDHLIEIAKETDTVPSNLVRVLQKCLTWLISLDRRVRFASFS